MRRAYAASTQLLSAIMVLVGLAMIITALARGGGPLALGVVLGLGLTGLGAARLWLMRGGLR
jgi:hypothetical protein